MCQLCHIVTCDGEYVHIVARSKDGPRDKQTLVNEGTITSNYELNKASNGLYLCSNCHTKIDKYPDKYPHPDQSRWNGIHCIQYIDREERG